MTAEQPDVTFLIPVYGAEKTLARALDSVFAQTLGNIECVAVNDASPDRSGAILEDYAAREPRLRIITLERNSGTLSARKRGAEAARGRYILSLDPDDTFAPDGAERLLKHADEKQADIVHFDTLEYLEDPDGSLKQVWNWCPAKPGFLSGKHAAVKDLLTDHGHYWNLCLKLIRREIFQAALKDIEDFHCVMCEDLYMDLAVELRAANILKVNEAPYRYHLGCGISADRRRSAAAFRRLIPGLRALELCAAMLPEQFRGAMREIQVKQCRILLTRAEKELDAADRTAILEELRTCGWCFEALAEAEAMPLLAGANEEDFLPGHPVLRGIIDAVLPKGTRRRVRVKTWVKRLLKKV